MALILIAYLILNISGQVSEFYPGLPKSAIKKMDKAIESTYGISNITKDPVLMDSAKGTSLAYKVPENALFILKDQANIIGLLYLSSAKGRMEQFDYMVLYDNDFLIRKIEILVYRSDHGYEIMNKKWLNQFPGNSGCGLGYGKDIQAISGATFSATSITKDLERLCKSLEELRSEGILSIN